MTKNGDNDAAGRKAENDAAKSRQDRLGAALRENLRKRKEQLRERERRSDGADDGENTK